MHPEQQYLNLLKRLLDEGDSRIDRTGIGTQAIFGQEMRFDLELGFPAFTTKRVFWKTAFKEMLWMLSGGRNIRELLLQNVKIWTDWPLKKYRTATGDSISQEDFEQRIITDEAFAQQWGDLGPVYGAQWRRWKAADGREIDQVSQVIELLKHDPSSRRIIWDGWNVGELSEMALPPCHKHYQFFVSSDGKLSGACIQRSVDTMLGCPFNVVNLALVIHLLAEQTGLKVGQAIWYGLDVHIYKNHIEQVQLQLQRTPRDFPKLVIKRRAKDLFDYRIEDFDLINYDPHPAIAAEVAV